MLYFHLQFLHGAAVVNTSLKRTVMRLPGGGGGATGASFRDCVSLDVVVLTRVLGGGCRWTRRANVAGLWRRRRARAAAARPAASAPGPAGRARRRRPRAAPLPARRRRQYRGGAPAVTEGTSAAVAFLARPRRWRRRGHEPLLARSCSLALASGVASIGAAQRLLSLLGHSRLWRSPNRWRANLIRSPPERSEPLCDT